jgi:HlyD family secretion protein
VAQIGKAAGKLVHPARRERADAAAAPSEVGPQRLQTAIRITTPASWIVGAVFAFLTVAVIVWGVLGELATRVSGLGIVSTENDEVLVVRSLAAGSLSSLAVAPGDQVEKGQVIARIGVPGQEAEVRAARRDVELLSRQYQQEQQRQQKDLSERLDEVSRKTGILEERKQLLRQRIGFLSDQLSDLQDELSQGLVVAATVQDVRDKLADARVQLNQVDIEISEANLDYLEYADQREADLASLNRQLAAAEATLERLQAEQSAETEVRAEVAGQVIELDAEPGQVVDEGDALLRIDAEGGELRVTAFFEAADGKKVGVGMDASVAPSTAESAIWGTLVGKVARVSELPATLEAVTETFGNAQMAEEIFSSGPPILVEVQLLEDPSTPSGLKWSSGEGPPYRITSGTMSGVSVVVRREAPANLVIPVFDRWIGHGG